MAIEVKGGSAEEVPSPRVDATELISRPIPTEWQGEDQTWSNKEPFDKYCAVVKSGTVAQVKLIDLEDGA